jgi:hypothetical protein
MPDADLKQLWKGIRWIESLFGRLSPNDKRGCLLWWWRSAPGKTGGPCEQGNVPQLSALSQEFGLNQSECNVLLLCAAAELEPRLMVLCARAQCSDELTYPTLNLALRLFHDRRASRLGWDVLSPNRPLLRWRLVEVHAGGSTPLSMARIKIDPRILSFLLGLDKNGRTPALPALVQRLVSPLFPVGGPAAADAERCSLSDSQTKVAEDVARALDNPAGRRALVQLLGNNAEANRLVARRAIELIAERENVQVAAYHLAWDEWPSGEDVQTFALLWQREQRLNDHIYLYLDTLELDPGDRERNAALDDLLAHLDGGRVVLAAREARPLDGRPARLFDVGKPTAVEQKKRWAARLKLSGAPLGRLVSRFNFNFPTIDALCERVRPAQDQNATVDQLLLQCRDFTRPRLGTLAELVETAGDPGKLFLPDADKKLIKQIENQVRNLSTVYDDWHVRQTQARGLGLSVLFAGESGTGKSFAAEVLAYRLRLDLYRIDLSAVMDKFVGETEKNLRRLFDAAEDGGCILLFDEADALFGKRGEVKDSHDRFAHVQINYLLQRLETFRGLAILTTNRKAALDVAFMRRLRFVVNFPFPSQDERRQMWEKALPPKRPDSVGIPVALSAADYDVLSLLSLTGGNIRTVALNAAFLAAEREGGRVTLETVKVAARAEFRKLGRAAPPELKAQPPRREGAA